jgi:hypothetical protein
VIRTWLTKAFSDHLNAGTLGGAFIVDYLGPKYTMVGSTTIELLHSSHSYIADQITGLLLQAVIGFIMSGLYVQYVPD